MNPVIIPWLLQIGLITFRSVTGTHFVVSFKGETATSLAQNQGSTSRFIYKYTGTKRPPLPSEILATFVAYGTYSVIAQRDARIGGLLAWGTLLGSFLLLMQPGPTGGTFPSNPNPLPNPPLPPGPNFPPQGGR